MANTHPTAARPVAAARPGPPEVSTARWNAIMRRPLCPGMDNDGSLQSDTTSQRQARAVQQIALVLYWTAGTIAVAAVLWALGDVLLLVFAAALLAAGLRGA